MERGATKTVTFGSMGRIDDVINVSGHRLGTAEIESALVSNAAVAEQRWWLGRRIEGICDRRFCNLGFAQASEQLKQDLRAHVGERDRGTRAADEIGSATCCPRHVGQDHAPLLRELATSGSVRAM